MYVHRTPFMHLARFITVMSFMKILLIFKVLVEGGEPRVEEGSARKATMSSPTFSVGYNVVQCVFLSNLVCLGKPSINVSNTYRKTKSKYSFPFPSKHVCYYLSVYLWFNHAKTTEPISMKICTHMTVFRFDIFSISRWWLF